LIQEKTQLQNKINELDLNKNIEDKNKTKKELEDLLVTIQDKKTDILSQAETEQFEQSIKNLETKAVASQKVLDA